MKKFIKSFSNLSFSNTMVKVFSLVLAVICWYGIQAVTKSNNTVYETDAADIAADGRFDRVVLPIRVVAPTRRSAFRIEVRPEQARVEVDFSRLRPDTERTQSLSLFIDCSDIASEGEYRLPISCVASDGARVIDIQPASAIVRIVFID